MTIFQQQHDGRAAQAVPCKGSKPGSIPGRAFILGSHLDVGVEPCDAACHALQGPHKAEGRPATVVYQNATRAHAEAAPQPPRHAGLRRQGKDGHSVRGLREFLPSLCDGFRPLAEIQEGSTCVRACATKQLGASAIGDREVRRGVRQLPPHTDIHAQIRESGSPHVTASNSRVAQLAERGTVNAQVRGSNPRSRANFPTGGADRRCQSDLENRGVRDERPEFDPSTTRQLTCGTMMVYVTIRPPCQRQPTPLALNVEPPNTSAVTCGGVSPTPAKRIYAAGAAIYSISLKEQPTFKGGCVEMKMVCVVGPPFHVTSVDGCSSVLVTSANIRGARGVSATLSQETSYSKCITSTVTTRTTDPTIFRCFASTTTDSRAASAPATAETAALAKHNSQRLGSSVVEHSVETRGVAGSIPALCTIFNMVGSSVVELRSPKPSVVGSIPTRHAIFKRMCDGAVTCRPAKTRPTLTGGGGSIPPASAILTRVRLLLVVGRQIVNLLIRNTVGSIPTARTSFARLAQR